MFASQQRRHRARPKFARRIAVLGIALVLGGVSVGIVSASAQAGIATPDQYAAETFTNAAVSNASAYKKLTTSSSSSTSAAFPCLTAGTNTSQTPVPGCSTTAIDSAGSGALRLTDANGYEAAGLGATGAVPTAQGLDVSFDSYQYGGSGADGIAFYLAATDPYNPTTPSAAGAFGGSLGYSTDRNTNGITDGYLGVGIDAWGNYQNSTYGGSTCTGDASTTSQTPSVSVRGAGNGKSGYCVISRSTLPSGAKLSGGSSGTRSGSDVPVEIAINPSSTATTTQGMTGANGKVLPVTTVPANSFVVVSYPIGASQALVTTGTLPSVATGDAAYQSGWYDANGHPYKLTYGWTSSTGGSTDVHEVNRFVASSLTGNAPVLAATATDPTTVTYGTTGTFVLQPSVASSGGAETGKVEITTVFPSGTTPKAGTYGSYTCVVSGQTATCDLPAGNSAAGSNLPALSIPFTETLPAGATGASITSTVASTDALKTATASSTVNVTKASTTTALSSSKNPSDYTDQVTFTATVSASPAGAVTPSGTVAFTVDGTTLCAAATVTNGVATCTTTSLAVGSRTVAATYSGDTNYTTSSSAPLVETVNQKATTLALTASPSGISYGSSSTLTATLPAAAKTATGSITFTGDNGETLTGTLSNGVATATTSTTDAVGTVHYTAKYDGDANFLGSTSNTATLTISTAPTTISETVNGKASAEITYGTSATVAATGLPAGATGTVVFSDATAGQLCEATVSNGGASCTTSTTLGAGTYHPVAAYSGDARYAASSSSSVALVVDKAAAPAITASASPSPSTYGDQLTLDETGIATPLTGSITYAIDGTDVCTATLPTTSCSPNTVPDAGAHQVVATWTGDANHTGGTSAAAPFTIDKATPTIGETVNDGSSASVAYGTQATLVATDIPSNAEHNSSVRFVAGTGDTARTLCTAVAANASCPTQEDLPVGTYSVVATWDGDTNHESASSAPVTLTISAQPTTITEAVNDGPSATIVHGQTATLTTAGLPVGATGSVEYRDGSGALIATGDASESGSPASTKKSLAAGTYQVKASYLGDGTYAPSTSGTVQLVVAKASPVITDSVNGGDTGTTTYGTPATLTVGDLPADATGTVEFRDQHGVLLCSVEVPAATACDTATTLGAGTYQVTATYLGDDNTDPATTATPATLTVAKAPGSVELGAATTGSGGAGGGSGSGGGTGTGGSGTGGSGSGGTGTNSGPADVVTTYGAPVTLTATGLPSGATGTVTFVDGDGNTLCSVDLATGTSCATDPSQATGTYTVTPTWTGDANHAPAQGDPFTITIRKASTQVTVVAGPATIWGETTTLTIGGLPKAATGTVTLRHGTTVICTITLPATTCSTSAIEPGTTTVTADYSGDASYAPSSATTPVIVAASHTVTPKVVKSGSTGSVTATWPAVPGADPGVGTVTIVISTSKDLSRGRTITVPAGTTSATIDGLEAGTQYYYRVTTTAADGTVLSTHDAMSSTALAPAVATTPTASATPVAAASGRSALAYTGSPFAIGLVGAGALMLLLSGGMLMMAARMRREDEVQPGPRRGLA